MNQIVKFINKNNKEIEFTNKKPFLLQQIDGLTDLKVDMITYKGFKQDGERYSHSQMGIKEITIKFSIVAETINQLMQIRKDIINTLNPKLGEGKLIYKYGDIERQLRCVSDGIPTIPLSSNKLDCEGTIVLVAHNPFFTDTIETKANITLWAGAFKFPLTISNKGIIMGVKNQSLIVNIPNNGDIECGMRIEFTAKGSVKNPSLFNVNTREYIKINKTLLAGEKIIINTNYGNKTILSELNGIKTNILNYYDLKSTFLQLQVGDNLFRYDADENLSNLEACIYYNQQYLGV